jgi:hypothetical protein
MAVSPAVPAIFAFPSRVLRIVKIVRYRIELGGDGEILVDGLYAPLAGLVGCVEGRPRSPSKEISPAFGCRTPVRTFMRVDFPAPLSPMRATTSPGYTSKSTPLSTCTAPKDFSIPRARSTVPSPSKLTPSPILLYKVTHPGPPCLPRRPYPSPRLSGEPRPRRRCSRRCSRSGT